MKTIIERGASWTLEETKLLLTLWGQDQVSRKDTPHKRTKEVYEKISEKFNQNGFERTPDQVRTRVFNMIAEYRRLLKDPNPERMKKCIFFDAMHKIYQAQHWSEVKSLIDDYEPETPFSPASNSKLSETLDEPMSDSEALDGQSYDNSSMDASNASNNVNNNNNINATASKSTPNNDTTNSATTATTTTASKPTTTTSSNNGSGINDKTSASSDSSNASNNVNINSTTNAAVAAASKSGPHTDTINSASTTGTTPNNGNNGVRINNSINDRHKKNPASMDDQGGGPPKRIALTARLPTTTAITSHQLYQAPVNTFDVTSSALLIDRMFAHLSRESENMREWIALEKDRIALEKARRAQEIEREIRRERVLVDTLMKFQDQWISFITRLDPRLIEGVAGQLPQLNIPPRDIDSQHQTNSGGGSTSGIGGGSGPVSQ